MKLELHGWSWSIFKEAGEWSMKLEYLPWSSSFMDEAGDGLYSVMSRSRFRLVYRQAIYSRQCAWSYGSGGVSKARGIYTCGCTKTLCNDVHPSQWFGPLWVMIWSVMKSKWVGLEETFPHRSLSSGSCTPSVFFWIKGVQSQLLIDLSAHAISKRTIFDHT